MRSLEGAGIFIEGDFPTGFGNCKYHCEPTCHPCNIGPDPFYGCLHPAWPSNKAGDFCPGVYCMGDTAKCNIPTKMLAYYLRGLRRRINNAEGKKVKFEKLYSESAILKIAKGS